MPPKQPQSPGRKLQKKAKGHEKSKSYQSPGTNPNQASLLSQSSSSRKAESFLLVALTVGIPGRNDFMIGDFAGIKHHMNIMGFEEKDFFWSTVNLGEYCTTSIHRDIKIRAEHSEKVVYSGFKAVHRQDDYLFVDQTQIKNKFLEWMKDVTRKALHGDVVNIILITHGHPLDGKIQFGNDVLTVKETLKLLSYFQKGVQVNLVTTACGSGSLCREIPTNDQKDRFITAGSHESSSRNGLKGWKKGMSVSGRFRSSFFTEVIIKSLGKLNFDRLGPTMEGLKHNLIQGVLVKPIGPLAKFTPQSAGSGASKEESETALQRIIHLDYFDFPPCPKRAARYLRQESDMQMQNYTHVLTECSTKPNVASAQQTQIMKAIYFRAKVQSACFNVVMFLQDQCLITLKGLEEPMQIYAAPYDEIRDVACALSAFDLFSGVLKYPFETYTEFTVRDLWCLFDRTSCYGELGALNVENLRDLWPEGRRIEVDPQAGVAPAWIAGRLPSFCFWLPHSMSKIEDVQEVYKYFDEERFEPYECLYFGYFRLPFNNAESRERQCSRYIKKDMLFVDFMET
ncbi:uncharacterized protein RAG0_13365 [Rhynchosporium agropyri]|uniref:Uncharacterized protein n=1 Tax=Rhynchosporium agropyri TaxID=914238 RepID=A0A1E1LCL7_9HELO|nr:uncharacterized protein RAG0_13365 [Rhynchosporium agropyri]